MRPRFCVFIIFLVQITAQLWACPESHALLRKRANEFIEACKYDSAYVCSRQFFESAQALNDSACIVKAHIFLWHTATKLGKMEEAVYHLQQAHIDNCATCNFDSLELNNSMSCIQNLGPTVRQAEEQHDSGFFVSLSVALLLLVCVLVRMLYRNRKSRSSAASNPVQEVASVLSEEAMPDQSPASPLSSTSVCSEWKRNDLVRQLDQLMSEQHLYREKLLTRDKVAELLGTNRTYLGQVLSEHYQKTFIQYINDLRIDEAIRILDDPDCKRPIRLIGLDLGFNSVTTFNTQFQNRTGMTPAQYRLQKPEKV